MKRNEYENVKIAIRWRPITEANREIVIEKVTNNLISLQTHLDPFLVDNVFDSSEQSEVFDVLVKPLIEKAIKGFDFTFLATGQTGSGKTYTMGFERGVDPTVVENSGIVARVLNSLFSHENADTFQIQISFVEVYNDQAFDLLNQSPAPFFTKSHPSKDVIKQTVNTESEVMALLSVGTEKRRVRGTKMNSTSSRSHVIFTIYLNIRKPDNKIQPSVINLVDLAGSEGFRKTECKSGTFAHAEAKSINESLAAFNRVITAMVCAAPHIPYRDSIITRLLKDSLNTRSYLTLLGCISPYKDDYGETLSTLRFVCEAKKMKMTPQMRDIITEFIKTKTPVKNLGMDSSFQTPRLKSFTQFKRPLSTIQNKLHYSSMRMTDPKSRKFMSSKVNYSATRIPNRVSAINSTSKKIDLRRFLRNSYGSQAKKSRAATNLFPVTAKHINESIANDSNKSDWSDALCSTVIESEPATIQSNHTDNTNTARKQIMQTLATLNTPNRELVLNAVRADVTASDQLKENDANVVGENEVEDIKPTETVDQSLLSSSFLLSSSPPPSPLTPHPPVKSFIEQCTDPTTTTTTSVSIKQIEEKKESPWNDMSNYVTMVENGSPSANTVESSMNRDSMILVSTTTDHVSSTSDCLNAPVKNQSLSSQTFCTINAIADVWEVSSDKDVDEFMETSIPVSTSINQIQENRSAGTSKVMGNFGNTTAIMGEEKTKAFVSPLIVKKIIKTNSQLDMQSMYEIAHKDRNKPAMLNQNIVDSSYSDMLLSFGEQDFVDSSTSQQYASACAEIPKSPAVKTISKTIHPFPFSPRIILQRAEDIEGYQSLKRAATIKITRPAKRAKRTTSTRKKTTKAAKVTIRSPRKSVRRRSSTSNVPTLSEAILNQRRKVLNILNNESEKALQRLGTIGATRALQIFTHRTIHGKFENIDAMLSMKFWTEKMHERFLINNSLI